MKTNKTLFGFYIALLLVSALGAFAQSPPNNDDFANRTVLTGSSVTFAGSLAGATIESGETNGPIHIPFYATGTVWWTWTAQVSGTVVISLSSPSSITNSVCFYTGNTLSALTLTSGSYFAPPAGRYLRFNVTAGTAYQIQVSGPDVQPFSFQLTATNPPIFVRQPKDCIVSPYGSAFFSAIATGPTSISYLYPPKPGTLYQWFFNGVPIPGETFPCLLIHRVTTNQVGIYSVIASNVGGITQGGSATLTVTDTNPVPSLTALPPNNPNFLRLTLSGEPGRWYKIESSTNLQDWVNPLWLQLTNPATAVSIQRLTPNHFVRASLDVPTEVCVAQLKQMAWAVNLVAIENVRNGADNYGLTALTAYVPLTSIFGGMPLCHEGGYYAAGGTLRDPPTCQYYNRGHVITDMP